MKRFLALLFLSISAAVAADPTFSKVTITSTLNGNHIRSGTTTGGTYNVDTLLINDEEVTPAGSATTTQEGLVELATNDESEAGLDSIRAVTPQGAKASTLAWAAETLINRAFIVDLNSTAWTHTTTGSGAGRGTVALDVFTGTATATSHVRTPVTSGGLYSWYGAGGQYNIQNWDLSWTFATQLAVTSSSTNSVVRVQWGRLPNDTSVSNLSSKGVSLRIENLALRVSVYHTSLTTSGTLHTLTQGQLYDIRLRTAAGNWECFVDGVSVGSGTGAPTGSGGSASQGITFSIDNGGDGVAARATIQKMIILRE
jgi:hypothetical protein